MFTNRVGEGVICRQTALQTVYKTNQKRFINGEPVGKLPLKDVWINPAHPDETTENIVVNFHTLSAAKKIRL